ncbi:5-formyltetrahydrofolate cyclo-ligase [Hathewaya histolytica]|uniref:5-formyltetrahydrofolate cyclo-ligase n=1 Tax=Hathewaya histolytica TaxID=1498 RepID=UPI003B6823A9
MFNNKKDIRNYIYNLRDNMKEEEKDLWDESIEKKLTTHPLYEVSSTIFIYVSFRGEVYTHNIIKNALQKNIKICVPKINKQEKIMEAYYINSMEDLEEGYFKVLEPKEYCKRTNNEDIDLIVSPGVAFDKEGGRVGYGGGFYDRFIGSLSKEIPVIALAYKFQILDKVILEDTDKKVDEILIND